MPSHFRYWLAWLPASALCTLTVAAPAAADSCVAKSGAATVALLELYTSEGCPNCPPADAWLNSLPGRGLTRERVVPLALHVDYWNDRGWEDPYSRKDFTRRQYYFALIGGGRTVYTPQFLLNGKDYRGWRRGDVAQDVQRINLLKPRADIALTLARGGKNGLHLTARADVRPDTDRAGVEMFAALFENNLSNRIQGGRNQGRLLEHDYVARRLLGPVAVDETGSARLDQTVSLEKDWKAKDLGVAVFIQNRRDGDVLQALALPLCDDVLK
jgi:hypothetical protein